MKYFTFHGIKSFAFYQTSLKNPVNVHATLQDLLFSHLKKNEFDFSAVLLSWFFDLQKNDFWRMLQSKLSFSKKKIKEIIAYKIMSFLIYQKYVFILFCYDLLKLNLM